MQIIGHVNAKADLRMETLKLYLPHDYTQFEKYDQEHLLKRNFFENLNCKIS